jgi:CubicO group peptidase (beta-lactamase class C family)
VRPLGDEPTDPGLLDLTVACHDGPRRLADRLLAGREDYFVVLHRGRLAAEWSAPGVGTDERHLIFSITKSVTGLLAGALAGAGLLDLEAPVCDLVTDLAGSGWQGATVRHLLDMQASYSFVEDYSPGPDIVAYRHAAGWYPAPEGAPALRAFLRARTQQGEHGQRFRYLSPTTDLLGVVCAAAAGSTWAQALSRYVWDPTGAEDGAEVTLDREGTPRAAGGLCARPRDVARLGQLVADGGVRDGLEVVPPSFVDDLTHGGDRAAWDAGDYADFLPGGAYRSCWYQPGIDPDVVCGLGIHGQLLYVDRGRDVVVVVLSSWAEPDVDEWHHDHLEAARSVAHALA